MRTFKFVPAIALALIATSAKPQTTLPDTVDLNVQALETLLRDSDPAEYRRVARFLEAAETLSCNQRELESMRVQLQVAELRCGFFLKTSNPPKRDVEFSTAARRYSKTITLLGVPGRLTPVPSP